MAIATNGFTSAVRVLWQRRMKLAAALVGGAVALASGPALANPTFGETTPSEKIGTAALLSPTTVDGYYGSSTTATNGLSLTGRPNEVVELARALKGNPNETSGDATNYPDKVVDRTYQYVRNNITMVWSYGLQKGALGALIDHSGTAFDQAALMVELLRQNGYTAKYQVGTIALSGTQFYDWSGITDAGAACQLLSSGAIGAVINGSTNSNCSYSGASVSTITLNHAWVTVTIGGTDYVFDPAFKSHDHHAGLNLATTASMTSGEALTAAGGTTGTEGTSGSVSYVQGFNISALNTKVAGYGTAILTTVAAHPEYHMEDVVSGETIHRYETPQTTGLRQTSVSGYTLSSSHTWTGGVPDQYRTTLEVRLDVWGPNATSPTTTTLWDRTLYVDEIYGRKLTVDTGLDQADGAPNYQVKLRLTDETGAGIQGISPILNSYSAANTHQFRLGSLILTANHPFAAAANGSTSTSGDYMDATVTKAVNTNLSFTIVHGWGDANGLAKKWDQRDDNVLPPDAIPGGCETCGQPAQGTSGDGKREQFAAAWIVQSSKAARLHAAIGNSVYTLHHSIGVMAGDPTMDLYSPFMVQTLANSTAPDPDTIPSYWTVRDKFDRMDVDSAFSLTSKSADAAKRRAVILSIAATTDALEGSVVAQQADLPDTVSTATRFEWGNAPPSAEDVYGSGTGRKFLSFTSSNASQATALAKVEGINTYGTTDPCASHSGGVFSYKSPVEQPEMCTAEANRWIAGLQAAVTAYTSAGFNVVAMDEAHLGPGVPWGAPSVHTTRGVGGTYTAYYTPFPTWQRGGALVAVKYSGSDPVEIAHVAVGVPQDSGAAAVAKGGGGGVQPDHDATYDPARAADVLKAKFVDHSSTLGVDISNGELTYTAPGVLEVGNGEFPNKLTAQLIWRGGEKSSEAGDAPQGQPRTPWTTNWHNMVAMGGGGLEMLGDTDPRTAAGTIGAFLAMQDVYGASPSIQRDVTGVLVNSWWVRTLTGNIVTVSVGSGTRQFVKLVDGSWIAPGAGAYASLAITGSRAIFTDHCGPTPYPPYDLTRGWDYSSVSFAVTNAHGDIQNFGFWRNDYHDGTSCQVIKGHRLTSWVYPQGVTVSLTYSATGAVTVGDPVDQLVEVSNTFGRKIDFVNGGTPDNGSYTGGFNNGLTGGDARSVSMSLISTASSAGAAYTQTDQSGNQTSIIAGVVPWYGGADMLSGATQIPNHFLLTKVYAADNAAFGLSTTNPFPSNPATLQYDYDSLRRVKTAYDAINLQLAARDPYQFYVGDGVRGERMDPTHASYAVEYDLYHKPLKVFDEINRVFAETHDGRGRVTGYTYPEGDQEQLAYDDRNNETSITKVAKSGSGLSNIAVSATWDSTWNKPLTITDALGNVTTLTYNASGNGKSLMATATRPADVDGNHPVYTFAYDSKGHVTSVTDPTSVVTSSTYDATTGDLLTTTLDPGTGTHVNAVTTLTYDAQGDVLTSTDPRSNVSYASYDLNRRKVFAIGPDPDGAGSLKRPTTKTIYDAGGRVTETDKGTATTTNASDFAVLESETTTYDPAGEKIKLKTQAGVAQYAYDGAGRVTCAALRMNSTVYLSLPSDACSLSTTGTQGPDRITKTVYDAAGQSLQTLRGYGTGAQITYSTSTYSQNGKLATITDANGNKTTYVYDGFDRLIETDFPSTTLAAGTSNSSDKELQTWDVNGNRLSLTKRDGTTVIDTCYDALGRPIKKLFRSPALTTSSCASITSGTAPETFSDYDLAGRPTHARFASRTGYGVDYAYDSAGRVTSETTSDASASRAVSFQYDAAGNRTRVTWPDSFYAGYVYDPLNRATTINENGATSGAGVLATYSYDDLGRRTSLSRGNGASTTYSYDSADRLTALTHDVTGATNDQTWSFGYNPASQLISRGGTNALYDWTNAAAGTTNKTYDGLNRDATIAALSGGYDANGNLTYEGTGGRTFTYDQENRLTSVATGGTTNLTLASDAAGRLHQTVAGSTTTQFLYEGSRLSAEFDGSGNVLRRYVHGTGTDEPIVWYEGSGTTDRRWLHQDAQGSVVGYSGSTGGMTTIYAYGPYGEPQSSSWGGSRFAYTGQIQLPEAKLYYYKARVYDPMSGRFLQADPTGYKDDLNLYAYVGDDPATNSDPTGTSAIGDCAHTSGCISVQVWDDNGKVGGKTSSAAPASKSQGQAAAKKGAPRTSPEVPPLGHRRPSRLVKGAAELYAKGQQYLYTWERNTLYGVGQSGPIKNMNGSKGLPDATPTVQDARSFDEKMAKVIHDQSYDEAVEYLTREFVFYPKAPVDPAPQPDPAPAKPNYGPGNPNWNNPGGGPY